MPQPAIRLSAVSKSYRLYKTNQDRLKEALHPFGKRYHKTFHALSDVTLNINRGEILGVVGRNGSGKSTLLKIVSKVLQPSTGSVKVDGKVSALLELGSGFNPEFTGVQNIFFYATILGLTRPEIRAKFDAIAEFADIGDYLQQPLKTYSSGMRARLAFAVAAHLDPEVLILDEVLAVGDDVFKRKCFAKMEEFFNGGRTVVYVSHDANSINQLCTRAILLDAGKVLMDDEPKTVTAYYQKFAFANEKNVDSVRAEIRRMSEERAASRGSGSGPTRMRLSRFLDRLVSPGRIEYRNQKVDIVDERLVDAEGTKVNVLEFGEPYWFEVEVRFGISCKNVSFGLEIKDIRGVVVSSVESAQLHRLSGGIPSVAASEVYRLRYEFPCLFTRGTYLMNFGVSTYNGAQQVLNRVIDIYMFKVENPGQFSSGYVQIVKTLEVSTNGAPEAISMIENEGLGGRP